MSNGPIILSVENFKFRIFDSVPKPEPGTAYVLYREEKAGDAVLVITPNSPVLGGKIKSGGFNKIMTISTATREFEIAKRIADTTGTYKFDIKISVFYQIKDIEYIFKHSCWDIDQVLENIIFQIIKSKHCKFDIDCEIELENELIELIPLQIKDKMTYLEITDFKVTVEVDERAKKVLDASLNTMADSIVFEKEKEKEMGEIEGKKQVEIQRLKAQKEVEHERNDVLLEKATGFDAIMEKLGEDMATAFLAYEKGEISGIELDDRIRNNKNASMQSQLMTLKNLADLEVISGPMLEQAAMKLIGQSDAGTIETPLDNESQEDLYTDSEEY